MNTPAARARRIASFLLSLAALTALPRPAHATSYVVAPVEEVAQSTDAWIHAKVASVRYGEIEDRGMDRVLNVTVQFTILRSTHEQLTGSLTVQSVADSKIPIGSEVFVALCLHQGRYVPCGGLRFNAMIEIDPGARVGPVPSDTYWRWLCSLQQAGSTNGQPTDDDLSYWETALASGDVGLQVLALKYFGMLEIPALEASTIFDVFLQAYETAAATVQPETPAYYEEKSRLHSLADTVIRSLKVYDSNAYAGAILDFIEYDATQLRMMQDHSFPSLMLSPLRRATRPEILERLPYICETFANANTIHDYFANFPSMPNAQLDAWLWEVVRDPVAHGATNELALTSAWKAMEVRNTPDLVPYLQRIAAGSEPVPVPPEHADQPSWAKSYAAEIILRIETNSIPRETRLVDWVRRVKQNELVLLPKLASEITPRDRFLIPELATLTPAQWLYPGGAPSFSFAADIMKRLPDPVFLPILREWCRKSAHPLLLKALEACGDGPLAKQKALAGLRTPIQPRISGGIDAYDKAEFLLLLGRIGGSDATQHVLPYANLGTLRKREPALAEAVRENEFASYDLLEMRDAALLALAKIGGPNAARMLRTAHADQDIRAKLIAAMALYAMGDNTGAAIVNAFRNRTEQSVPEIAEQWRNDLSEKNFATIISYLESPRLDALYFERTKEAFTYEDLVLGSDPDFFERNRLAVLEMLISYLGDKDLATTIRAIECLRTNTGQLHPYNRSIPAERAAAIQWWKEYVAAELAK